MKTNLILVDLLNDFLIYLKNHLHQGPFSMGTNAQANGKVLPLALTPLAIKRFIWNREAI